MKKEGRLDGPCRIILAHDVLQRTNDIVDFEIFRPRIRSGQLLVFGFQGLGDTKDVGIEAIAVLGEPEQILKLAQENK